MYRVTDFGRLFDQSLGCFRPFLQPSSLTTCSSLICMKSSLATSHPQFIMLKSPSLLVELCHGVPSLQQLRGFRLLKAMGTSCPPDVVSYNSVSRQRAMLNDWEPSIGQACCRILPAVFLQMFVSLLGLRSFFWMILGKKNDRSFLLNDLDLYWGKKFSCWILLAAALFAGSSARFRMIGWNEQVPGMGSSRQTVSVRIKITLVVSPAGGIGVTAEYGSYMKLHFCDPGFILASDCLRSFLLLAFDGWFNTGVRWSG